MNWAEDEYVRIYKRQTPELAGMGYRVRVFWWELLRLTDNDGRVNFGSPHELAAVTGCPVDEVQAALERLCAPGGPAIRDAKGLLCRNYVVAQITPRSDAARQRESRRNRAAQASRDASSGKDVPMSHEVTEGHTASQNVTLDWTGLDLKGGGEASPPPPPPQEPSDGQLALLAVEPVASKAAKKASDVAAVWEHFMTLKRGIGGECCDKPTPKQRTRLSNCLDRWSVEQLCKAIDSMFRNPYNLGQKQGYERIRLTFDDAFSTDRGIEEHIDNYLKFHRRA